jgi:hypothetical protein
MMGHVRFAIEDEPRPKGPRTKGVYAGHHRIIIDDIAKEIVIVETKGAKEIRYPFTPTHRMFAETAGPPSIWVLYRHKKELVEEHFGDMINE